MRVVTTTIALAIIGVSTPYALAKGVARYGFLIRKCVPRPAHRGLSTLVSSVSITPLNNNIYSHGSPFTSMVPPTPYVGNTLYNAYDGPLTHGLFIVDTRSCESSNWHQSGSTATTICHLTLRANRGAPFGSFSEKLAISFHHRSVWPKVPPSTGTWNYDRYIQTGAGCNSLPPAAAFHSSSTPRQSVQLGSILRFPPSFIRSCRHPLTYLEW